MFCPLIKGECKQGDCMFALDHGNDKASCGIAEIGGALKYFHYDAIEKEKLMTEAMESVKADMRARMN